MFGPKLRLQQLTVLDTGMVIPGEAADLDRLVSSCRHLRGLSMCCSDGLLLTPLLRLKALNMLWVNGVTDRCTALSLAQLSGLTGLRALLITEPCQLTDYEVCSLTALKRLTCLTLTNVDSWRFSKAMQQRLRPFKEFLHDGFPCCVCWTIRNTVSAVMISRLGPETMQHCRLACHVPCQRTPLCAGFASASELLSFSQ